MTNQWQPTPAEIEENYRKREERDRLFAQFGYDTQGSMDSVLAHVLPAPAPLLEFATGKGRFLSLLARHVPRIVTVELDPVEQRVAMLNAAHAGVLDRVEFRIADGEHLPWPDHFFGGVVSMNTMHHVANFAAVLRELARVTRPDGRMVISDFDDEGFRIMDRIHAAEGKTHPRGLCHTPDLVSVLTALGWSTEVHPGRIQTIVVARGPAAVPPAV